MSSAGSVAAAVVSRLINHPTMGGLVTDATCFVSLEDTEPTGEGEIMLRVIPDETSRPHASSGSPLEAGQLRIVAYRRVLQDRVGRDDRKFNAPVGLMDLCVKVEQALAYTYLDGILIEPLIPQAWIPAPITLALPDYAGRMMRCTYSIRAPWTFPQTMIDGLTPDRGQEPD